MQTFEDRAGRTWSVEITVSALKRVRDLAKVDLGQIAESPDLAKRLDDLATLGSVLYAILQPQAKAKNLAEDAFLDALDGPAMARAAAAFWPELTDFFRPCLPLVGGLIALALEVRQQAQAENSGNGEQGTGNGAEATAPVPRCPLPVPLISGSESTGSPAPSASIPAP